MKKTDIEEWWQSDVQNYRAAFGMFGAAPPPFENLQLSEISLRDPCEIALVLTKFDLPENSPGVWRLKQYDALQLRVLICAAFNMRMEGVFPKTTIRVALGVEHRKISIKIDDPFFCFEVEYHAVLIDFFPFKRADYENSSTPSWNEHNAGFKRKSD